METRNINPQDTSARCPECNAYEGGHAATCLRGQQEATGETAVCVASVAVGGALCGHSEGMHENGHCNGCCFGPHPSVMCGHPFTPRTETVYFDSADHGVSFLKSAERTEMQDSAIEEAREAVMRSWGMMNRLYEEHVAGCPQFSSPQAAVIGPRDAESKSFWQLVTELEDAISREAEERLLASLGDSQWRAIADALRARAEAAERERDYLRSVVEQLHRDAHDALGETEAR